MMILRKINALLQSRALCHLSARVGVLDISKQKEASHSRRLRGVRRTLGFKILECTDRQVSTLGTSLPLILRS